MKFFHTFIRILKEIHTRPTKYFILLVLSIVGLFFLAYMHNYNIVYLMMFFTFSLAGASSIIGRLNLYELQVSLLSAQDLFANQASEYSLNIYNPNPDRESYALECTNKSSTVIIDTLAGLQKKAITLSFTPTKRGKTHLPDLQIGSYFPLPHEILYKTVPINDEVIIYPEAKGKSLDTLSSKHKALFGEQEDFEGIKLYKEGEPLSLIYWPSVAKGTELMSKEFSLLEKSKHLHFDFITSAESDEQRLSQLCLWAIECKKKGISYSMHFPNTTLNSRSRSHHEILTFLALY